MGIKRDLPEKERSGSEKEGAGKDRDAHNNREHEAASMT